MGRPARALQSDGVRPASRHGRERQAEEDGTRAGGAGDRQVFAEQRHEAPADGEAQPGAAGGVNTRR
jgi:hypothetical protein